MRRNRVEPLQELSIGISGIQALSVISSPQSGDLLCITGDDYLQVDPQSSDCHLTMEIQRYALAILYFLTGGPGWLSGISFLNNEEECKWNEKLNLKWKSGVVCDLATGVVD